MHFQWEHKLKTVILHFGFLRNSGRSTEMTLKYNEIIYCFEAHFNQSKLCNQPQTCNYWHMTIASHVQELNSGTEASFSFFISNIFRYVKRKNIAFRMFWFNLTITLHEQFLLNN